MARRSSFCVSVIGCALVLAGAARAATVEPVQGKLSLNQGQGFQPVNSRVNANVGDTVVVGPGGAAAVTYPDGCKVPVQPGAVTTIAPLSPCASGSLADDNDSLKYFLGAAAGFGLAGFGIYEIVQHNNNNNNNNNNNHPISP